MATQESAARYADIVLDLQSRRTLSGYIGQECDLRAGTFRWQVEPTIDENGEWFDPATAPPPGSWGAPAVVNLFTPLLTEGAVAVIEEPMVLPSRPDYYNFTQVPGLRAAFKDYGDEVESFLLLEPPAGEASVRVACGVVVGAYYFVGIVTRRGIDDLPQHGQDVSDEQVREWARGTTHFVFRGPSYDGYVLWERDPSG